MITEQPNTETTAGKIAVMMAFEDGKRVQYKDTHHRWATVCRPTAYGPTWRWYDLDYRIHPEDLDIAVDPFKPFKDALNAGKRVRYKKGKWYDRSNGYFDWTENLEDYEIESEEDPYKPFRDALASGKRVRKLYPSSSIYPRGSWQTDAGWFTWDAPPEHYEIEPEKDPHQPFKDALAEGKRVRVKNCCSWQTDAGWFTWDLSPDQYEIEPEEDPYKPFKDALASGKRVRYRASTGYAGPWETDAEEFAFDSPPDQYEIESDPQPWDMTNVPPVCWIRYKGRTNVFLVTEIGTTAAETANATYSYAALAERYEYSTDLKEWKPCTK